MKSKILNYLLLAFVPALFLSSAAYAAPAFTTQQLFDNGGKAVAVNGEWAFVGASQRNPIVPAEDCRVYVYKFDYFTRLWGDGAGTSGDPYTVLGDTPGCANSEFLEFGRAVSVANNLLIVGAPGANDGISTTADGRIYFYRYDAALAGNATGGWMQDVAVGLPQVLVGGLPVGDVQAGARFGDTVSVRYDPLTDTAILLAGAPAYDGPADPPNNITGVDTGKFYMYSWDGGTDSVAFISQVLGENDGDAFGSAVTSNGVSFLIGAPLYDTVSLADLGAAYLYEFDAINSVFTLTQRIVADIAGASPITQGRIGTAVALSTDGLMLLGGGDGTDGGAYVLELTNTPSPGDYSFVTQVDQSDGGDVSIDGKVAAFGFNNFSVRLYFDKEDIGPTEDLRINGPGYLDYARDISLSKNRLLANGDQQNEATAYYLPCGTGGVLTPYQWKMIGLSCLPSFNNISFIFSDDLGTYDTNWVMYKQSDGTDFRGHQPDYVKLGAGDSLELGVGYWIITDDIPVGGGAAVTSKKWNVDALVSPVSTPVIPDPVPTAGGSERPAVVVDTIATAHSFDLSAALALAGDPPLNQASDFKIMLANPYPTAITYGNNYFQFIDGGGVGIDTFTPFSNLAVAPLFFEGSDTSAYVYDATGNGGLGGYIAIAPTTPGFTRKIEPGEGYYIRLSALYISGQGSGVRLLQAEEK